MANNSTDNSLPIIGENDLSGGCLRINRNFQLIQSQVNSLKSVASSNNTATSVTVPGGTPLSLHFSNASGSTGTFYSAILNASGGTSPYTFSLISGTLPLGLSLNISTGAITGTPTTAATSTFTAKVTDSLGSFATLPCTITITTGGGGSPPAPNVTSATITVNPIKIFNDYDFYLSGTITIPSAATALATIVVSIIGLDASSCIINAPTGGFGTSVAYQTPNYSMPLAAVTYTLDFIAVSGSGVATASPYSNTVTVTPATIVSLAITEIGPRTITIGDQLTTISITPTLANLNALQQITFWYSRDGGTSIYLIGWYPFYPGTTTALQLQTPIVASGLSGGLTSNNYIIYAVVGVQPSPGSPQTSITYATLHTAFPSVVTSNTITLLPAAPTASATLFLANTAGSPATQANIYSGDNSLGNPYATIAITVGTPGGIADPNALLYSLFCQWVDSSGNPITPGGVNNPTGYQTVATDIPNSGQLFIIPTFYANYPAPSVGANAYLKFYLYGLNQNAVSGFSGLQTPPFTGNPGAVLQAALPVQIGQPPTGLLGQQNTASVIQSPATSLIPDFSFSQDQIGFFPQPSQWSDATGLSNYLIMGTAQVKNDGIGSSTGGVQNYCRITGFFALSQLLTVPTGQALYFAVSARSNTPTLGQVSQIFQLGVASGLAAGTYGPIPLNGVGGTGATCTIQVNSTTIISAVLNTVGSGYTNASSFNVTITAAGGSGLVVTVQTSYHELAVSLTAYDSNGVNVTVGGLTTNYLLITGNISAWEQPAHSATFLYPPNVAYVFLQVETTSQEATNGSWDFTTVLLQPVQNQSTGTQINSQVPQTQTSGMSAVYATSTSSPANSTYGLAYMVIEDASGGEVAANVGSGNGNVVCSNGTNSASIGASAAGGNLNVQYSAGASLFGLSVGASSSGLSIVIGTAGGTGLITITGSPTIVINGHTAVTGATVTTSAGTKNIESGFITS